LSLVARITVSGDPHALREYRGEVNRLLDEEGGASFRELHTPERLEYEFRVNGGIPFPPFVFASQAHPDVTVEVRWSDASLGRAGRAVIRNGVLAEQAAQSEAPGGDVSRTVRAARDGTLELAVSCARWQESWHGYVLVPDQHAFFRVTGSAVSWQLRASDGVEARWAEEWNLAAGAPAHAELAPPEPIREDELRELDRIAQGFAHEWIWFGESPLEETAVERQRFAAYGYPVRAANLRSEKLRSVLRPEGGSLVFGSFREHERWVPALLELCWLRARTHEAG